MSIMDFFARHRGLPFRSMTVFNYLLEAALAGGILILLLLLVRQVFRRKLGNRLIYMAWLLVAVRLLLPVALPNPLMDQFRPTYSVDAAARPVADQVRVRFQDALCDLSWSVQERAYEAEGSAPQAEAVARQLLDLAAVNSYGWTGKWFLIGYAVVVAGVAVWMAATNARFRRRLRKGRVAPLTEEEQAMYLSLCHEMGVKRPLPVWRVDPLAGACLVGVARPYIALPLTLKPEELPFALTHELCHHKAHDEWWSLLRLVCCAVQWFNPLVWIGAKVSRTDCELACDDRVTAAMDDDQRHAYAQVLLATAARRSRPGMTVLATGMTMNGKRLKKRLLAIVQCQAVRRGAAVTFAALALTVTLLAFCTAESTVGGTQSVNASINEVDTVPAATQDWLWTGMDADRPTAVTNEAEAVEAARWYINALNNAGMFDFDSSVLHAPEGWYVSFSLWGRDGMVMALVDDTGRLRGFEQSVLPRQMAAANDELPSGTDEATVEHIRRIAENILGAEMGGEIRLAADEMDEEGRYLTYEADIGGETCRFTFRQDGQSLLSFSAPVEKSAMTQADVMAAAWDALGDELGMQRQRHDTYTEAFYLLEPIETEDAWQVTVILSRKDQTATVQEALEQRFGRHTCYTLQLTVDGSGHASALALLPEELTADVPADAKTGVTAVYTETYAILAGSTLRREETLPVGVPYTIIRDNGVDASTDTSYERYLLIRYVSPEGGDEIERWMADPAVVQARSAVVPNPVLEGDAWQTFSYTDDTGAAYSLPMLDKTAPTQGTATSTDATIPLDAAFALAVETVDDLWGVPPEALLTYRGTFRYVTEAGDFPVPYWQFDIYLNEADFYEIIFSAETGETFYLASPSEGNG